MRRAFLLLLVSLHFACPASTVTFHVSPSGSDNHPGTAAKPFATLERAREAVRLLRQKGSLPREGITVQLEAGDHLRTNTFELTPVDSGTEQSPITWLGAAGKQVRLLGG